MNKNTSLWLFIVASCIFFSANLTDLLYSDTISRSALFVSILNIVLNVTVWIYALKKL